MKVKIMATLLALVMICTGAALTGAATLPAKQLLINQIENYNTGINEDFYDKSSGAASYELTKLDGSLIKEFKSFQGSTLKFDNKFDAPNQKGEFEFELNFDGKTYNSKVFIANDKIIVNKELVLMLHELLPGADLGDIDQYPEYLYITRAEFGDMWKSMMQYRDEQIPQEFKDFLVFFVEAIPDKYLSVSLNSLTFELDQAGFEDVVYSILNKVQNEKERFAELVAALATMSNTSPQIDPDEIKAEIIAGIEASVANGTFPTREQISVISQFVEVKEFSYKVSLVPGGLKQFTALFEIVETSGFSGQIAVNAESEKKSNELIGTYSFDLDLLIPGDTQIDGALETTYNYGNETADSEMIVSALAQNNTEKMLELELTGQSTQKVDPALEIDIPELNSTNSLDISGFIDQPIATDTRVVNEPAEGSILIFVDGKVVTPDTAPFTENGRTMVPFRFVAEALDCEVKWIEPDEVRVTRGQDVISMYVGKDYYMLNDVRKQMDAEPVTKENRTFVPVRFLAESLNCDVKWEEPNKVVISGK